MSNGTEASKQKKGLGTLAWIAIGCGGLLVIVVAVLVVGGLFVAKKVKDVAGDFESNPALAAARIVVRLNPELEEVAVDEDAGTMTIRNSRTGEEVTVDLEDIKEGRIRWEADGKEMTIDASSDEEGATLNVTGDEGSWKMTTGAAATGELPDWVPVYPGTEPESRHEMEGNEGLSGGFQLSTDDAVSEVVQFYRARLEELGFAVHSNLISGDEGEQGGLVSASHEGTGRNVVVMVGAEEGRTTIGVSYNRGS